MNRNQFFLINWTAWFGIHILVKLLWLLHMILIGPLLFQNNKWKTMHMHIVIKPTSTIFNLRTWPRLPSMYYLETKYISLAAQEWIELDGSKLHRNHKRTCHEHLLLSLECVWSPVDVNNVSREHLHITPHEKREKNDTHHCEAHKQYKHYLSNPETMQIRKYPMPILVAF